MSQSKLSLAGNSFKTDDLFYSVYSPSLCAVLRTDRSYPPEIIELLTEDQAFSLLYEMAPHPPHPFPVRKFLSFSVFLCDAGRGYWREKEPNHKTARKAGPL